MSDVLVFIDWYLPGYKAGGPVTSVSNMIDAMRSKLRFEVVTSDRDYCAEAPYPNIVFDQWVERKPNEKVIYLQPSQQTFSTLRKLIRNSSAKTIYINGIYSLRFSILPLMANRTMGKHKKRVVIASRGMLSQSAIDVKQNRKKLFLKAMWLLGAYRNVVFHATNEKEKEDVLREIGSSAHVVVASNIVKQSAGMVQPPEKNPGAVKLVSIARIAPEKNLLFLLEALREVSSTIELNLYGAIYNESYWEKCLDAIDNLPKNIAVAHLGLITPDEVESAIQQHHFLVLPSRGENFGHVVAEAFLAGRPVLISDQTPWKNLLSVKAGFDLELDQTTFANAIVQIAEMNTNEYDHFLRGAQSKGESISGNKQPALDHLKMFLPETERA